MKIHDLFVLAALSLTVPTGCDDKAEEIPFVAEFAVDDAKITGGSLVIEDREYVNYVILAANTNDWEVDYTPKGDWLAVTKFAEGESNRIKVEAKENASFGERTGSVVFKYGGKQIGSLNVRQLGSAIILETEESGKTVSLSAARQYFEIALLANTDYTISYEPESVSEWLWELVPDVPDETGGTRAVGSAKKTLVFRAGANEGLPGRSGDIVFTAGDKSCRVTVNQLGNIPDIIADETPVELAHNGTQLEIAVTSNVAYAVAVEYAGGEGWLTPAVQGLGMAGGSVKYTVAENAMAEARSARIILTYVDAESGTDIRKEIPVTQKGRLAMIVSETVPAVSEGGIPLGFPASTFTVKLSSNTVSAPVAAVPDWIVQEGEAVPEPGFYTYTFSFGDNNGYVVRTGSIDFVIYGETGASVAVSQAVGALYEDQIAVIGAKATSQRSVNPISLTYDGDKATFYDSNYGVTPYPTETLVYRLEDAPSLGYIMYYPRTNGNRGCFKDVELSVATVDDPSEADYTPVKSFEVPVYYHQSNANAAQGYKIAFDTPLRDVKYVKFFVKTTHAGVDGHISCSEMQFFRTAVQNEEYAAVVSTTLPSGALGEGNFVPSEGGGYRITLNTNLDFPFECSEGVVITGEVAPFSFSERAVKTWNITIPANTTGLWKQHTIKIKGSARVFATLSVPQIHDVSKITAEANSFHNSYPVSRTLDGKFPGGDAGLYEIWESAWGGPAIDETNYLTLSYKFNEIPDKLSRITLVSRSAPNIAGGDWFTFSVTVKSEGNPVGEVIYSQVGMRQNKVFDIVPGATIAKPAEVYIRITKTNGTTGSLKQILFW